MLCIYIYIYICIQEGVKGETKRDEAILERFPVGNLIASCGSKKNITGINLPALNKNKMRLSVPAVYGPLVPEILYYNFTYNIT